MIVFGGIVLLLTIANITSSIAHIYTHTDVLPFPLEIPAQPF